jgi:hypothetical protein
MSVDNLARLPREELEELEAAVQDHTTLEKVVRWAMLRARVIEGVVEQDEYTLDVIVPIDDEGRCLVYDTT